MTRGTIRTLLRRRLQEDTPGRWSDAQLNEIINLALTEIETEILKVDPDAFHWIDRADVVKDQEFYEFPAGCWFEYEVRIKQDDGTYKVIRRVDYLRRSDYGAGSDQQYARFSREHFALVPIPTKNVTNGIEMVWTPTLTMATDNDVPPIHLGLHRAVLLMAEIIAGGDTGEGADDDTVKDVARMINGIGQFYLRTGSTPQQIVVEGIEPE